MRYTAILIILGLGGIPALGADAAPASHRLTPAVPGCPLCELWLQYEDVVLQAKQEVGRLENGVFYFYHSDRPSVIEPLIRFAHERDQMDRALREQEGLRDQLRKPCGHWFRSGTVSIQISTSARGILAVLTTENAAAFARLRDKASEAVRAKVPFWF